jgi:hypothetical protein
MRDVEQAMRESLYDASPYLDVLSPAGNECLTKVNYEKESSSTHECPITLEPFTENEVVTKLPCNHVFNTKAIEHWLATQNAQCPVCRYQLPSMEIRNPEQSVRRRAETTIHDDGVDTDIQRGRNALMTSLRSLYSYPYTY